MNDARARTGNMRRRLGWGLLILAAGLAGACVQAGPDPASSPAAGLEGRTSATAAATQTPLPDAAAGATAAPSSEPATPAAGSASDTPRRAQFGQAAINSLVFSPNGEWLAIASADGTVGLSQTGAGAPAVSLTGHAGQVRSLAFSADGDRLASAGDDGTIRIWRVPGGEASTVMDSLLDHIDRLAFSPDGAVLAVAGSLCSIEIRDASLGILIQTLRQGGCQTGADGWVDSWGLAFTSDGATLFAGEGRACCGGSVWRYDRQQGRYAPAGRVLRSATPIQDLSVSPGTSTIAVAASGASIDLWDTADLALERTLAGHIYRVLDVDFSPDGTRLATASRDGTVRLWRVDDGELLRTLDAEAIPTSLAFSPDGRSLACGTDGGAVLLWDLPTG